MNILRKKHDFLKYDTLRASKCPFDHRATAAGLWVRRRGRGGGGGGRESAPPIVRHDCPNAARVNMISLVYDFLIFFKQPIISHPDGFVENHPQIIRGQRKQKPAHCSAFLHISSTILFTYFLKKLPSSDHKKCVVFFPLGIPVIKNNFKFYLKIFARNSHFKLTNMPDE